MAASSGVRHDGRGDSPAALFGRLLGADFARLPRCVRALHDAALPAHFQGRARVLAGETRLARLIARCLGLPSHAGEMPIAVLIEAQGSGQRWMRQLSPPRDLPVRRAARSRPMVSVLSFDDGLLRERLGPVTVRFRVCGDERGLRWELRSVHLLGMPLPLAWFGAIAARELEAEGRYRFCVSAGLPVIGRLVAYEGWLDVT